MDCCIVDLVTVHVVYMLLQIVYNLKSRCQLQLRHVSFTYRPGQATVRHGGFKQKEKKSQNYICFRPW